MILEALSKTIDSFRLAVTWKVLILSAIVTIMIFSALVGIAVYLLGSVDTEGIAWLAAALSWLGSGTAIFLSYLLFPLTLPLITSLFLDYLAGGIENHYYPNQTGKDPAIIPALLSAVKLFFVLVILNILLLPLYLIPIVNIAVYFLLNGYLIGREYFELVALRHMKIREAKLLRRAHRPTVIISGILITLAATTPVVNLVAPVLATIFIVHVFHGFISPGKQTVLPPV